MQRLQTRSPLSHFVVIFALSLGLLQGNLYAQLSSAAVTGVVRDASGTVVAGVKLLLTNIDTTVTHTAESNSAGNYVFLSITPGTYSREATDPDFQTTQMSRFTPTA